MGTPPVRCVVDGTTGTCFVVGFTLVTLVEATGATMAGSPASACGSGSIAFKPGCTLEATGNGALTAAGSGWTSSARVAQPIEASAIAIAAAVGRREARSAADRGRVLLARSNDARSNEPGGSFRRMDPIYA